MKLESGNCPNCGILVWQGPRPPEKEQLVVCHTPMCWTDCSMPLTFADRAADFERRVNKYVAAYEVDRTTAETAVPWLMEREREYGPEVERLKKRFIEQRRSENERLEAVSSDNAE